MKRICFIFTLCLIGLISRFNAQGGWEWYHVAASNSREGVLDVAVDESNNVVYAVGFWEGDDLSDSLGTNFTTGGGGEDALILKYDTQGNLIWGFSVGGTGDQVATGVDVDDAGNVYVCGYFENSTSFAGLTGTAPALTNNFSFNGFLAKYTPNGQLLWVGETEGTGVCESWDVVCDSSGAYVTGSYSGAFNEYFSGTGALPNTTITATPPGSGENMFVCRYDSSGTLRWAADAGSSGSQSGRGVAIDDQYVYVAGEFTAASFNINDGNRLGMVPALVNVGFEDVFVMTLSKNDGQLVWVEHIRSTEEEIAGGVAVADGKVLITGSVFNSNLTFPGTPAVTLTGTAFNNYDAFITALDTGTGQASWGRINRGQDIDMGRDVVVDGFGNCWISGIFRNGINIGGSTFTSQGQDDIFLIQYEISTGNLLQADQAGDPDKDESFGMDFGGQAVYLGGFFHRLANFPPLPTVNHVNNDNLFVASWESIVIAEPDTACGNVNSTITLLPLQNDVGTFSGSFRIDSIVLPPTNGTLVQNNDSTLIYTPGNNFSGLDSLQIRVCDNLYDCDSSWIYLSIVPKSNAGVDTSVCHENLLALNGTDPGVFSGIWTVASGSGTFTNANLYNTTVTGLTTGTNEFVWTIEGGGCLTRDTVEVTVFPVPTAQFSTLTGTLCAGDNGQLDLTLTGASPWEAILDDGTNTLVYAGISTANYPISIAPPTTSTYRLDTLTDANGCRDTLLDTSPINVTITVNPLPVTSFTGLSPTYCEDEGIASLAGTPSGGVFAGPGIAGVQFDPGLPALGAHEITYTFTDVNNCTGRDTQTVVIHPVDSASFTGLPDTLCANASPVTLVPSPVGGTFSGIGVTGNQFDPLAAGMGLHFVLYTYSNANACQSQDSQTVWVDSVPVVSFVGLPDDVCIDDAPFALAGQPAGGIFSGSGVSNGQFDPVAAGIGPQSLTYDLASSSFCTATAIAALEVHALPVVAFSPMDTLFCSSGDPVGISGTPIGGVFSGPGVNGTQFDPVGAGLGTHTVVYTYTDAISCVNQDSILLTVSAAPAVSFGGLDSTYCTNDLAAGLLGTPTGGIFSGPGVSGNTFDPNLAGAGNHQVQYLYSAGSACTDSVSRTVEVNAVPAMSILGLDPMYCINETGIPIMGEPIGGTFTGPGVTVSGFDPALAGVGACSLTYTYVTPEGCETFMSAPTEVFDAPTPVFAGDDLELYLGENVQLSALPLDLGTGSWSRVSGAGEIEDESAAITRVFALEEGENVFRWTAMNGGCEVTDEVLILLNEFPEKRGLSPNEDGANDYLRFEGLEQYPESQLTILTRWGSPVFDSDDYQNDWNGNNKTGEPLPDDTYYFVLTLKETTENPKKEYKGFVVLSR